MSINASIIMNVLKTKRRSTPVLIFNGRISCDSSSREDGDEEVNKRCSLSFKTVKYLSEVGVKELPSRFILPEAKRPNANSTSKHSTTI
jgi:hypothetical protein